MQASCCRLSWNPKGLALFGDIDPERDIEDLVTFAKHYADLPDGWCSSLINLVSSKNDPGPYSAIPPIQTLEDDAACPLEVRSFLSPGRNRPLLTQQILPWGQVRPWALSGQTGQARPRFAFALRFPVLRWERLRLAVRIYGLSAHEAAQELLPSTRATKRFCPERCRNCCLRPHAALADLRHPR